MWRLSLALHSSSGERGSLIGNVTSHKKSFTRVCLTKAVEQLGATREEKTEDRKVKTVPNTEVRLGAIYALEKLAGDYLPLHCEIIEILCAYVRKNSG